MRRYMIAILATVASTAATQAQQTFNPWGVGGQPNPWLQGYSGSQAYYGPQVGRLPNGTPIHNPWHQYRGVQPVLAANYYNLAVQYNTQSILNPSLYSPYSFNSFNRFTYPGNFNPGFNAGYSYDNYSNYYPRYEREVGSFVPVNPQLAVNPFSGTVLNPIRGVALTREGPFYRLPGTSLYNPWGNPVYGSGIYYNPFTGSTYTPLSGVIAR
jgi:hypothetical protein